MMFELEVNPFFLSQLEQHSLSEKSLFDFFMKIEGRCVKPQKGRETLYFEREGNGFYIKKHYGVGWRELLKNIIVGRWPVLGAKDEWIALHHLENVGIRAAKPVAFGERGLSGVTKKSFIVTEEITEIVNLEKWVENSKNKKNYFQEKRKLIPAIADLARKMHESGMNHRDFYLCHLLLKEDDFPESVVLYVMDLHRAQIRSKVPFRWRAKDLSALYFSSLEAGLTKRDLFRFLKRYFNEPLREVLKNQDKLLKLIYKRAFSLKNSTLKKMNRYG